jgi:hypothetical protein
MKITLLKVSLGLSMLAVSLSAQSAEFVRVHVPFSFVAGGTTLPAGDYVIQESGSGAGLLLVQGRSAKGAAALMTTASYSGNVQREPGLTFVRSGGKAVLTRVQMAGEPSRLVNLSK